MAPTNNNRSGYPREGPTWRQEMAKKLKTTNKPDALIKDDGREKMYQGSYKDDVYKDDPEKQEAAGTEEATQQEPQGFMDSNNMSAVPENVEVPTEKTGDYRESKAEHDYKKRYDDLKTYYDQKLNEWKQEKEKLSAETEIVKTQQQEVKYTPPKTREELEQFKEKYPDVYQVVETISHDMAEQKTADLQAKISDLTEKEQKLIVQSAYKQLTSAHPDFNEIKATPEFLAWLEEQPASIADGIRKNKTDSRWAIRTVDLYKADVGISSNKVDSKRKYSAAQAVSKTKASPATINTGGSGKIWKMSEIQHMKPWKFEKNEAEIDAAQKEGRIDFEA